MADEKGVNSNGNENNAENNTENNSVHIPTMPQASDTGHIPTMPQTADTGHIPTMPQNAESGHIPTMPQSSDTGHVPTMPQIADTGHVPTMPQGESSAHVPTTPQNRPVAAGAYGTVAVFVLETDLLFTSESGNQYIILKNRPVSLTSGESKIYRCKSVADDDDGYVARILTSLTPRSSFERRANRKTILNFLLSRSENEDSNILPITDHGKVEVNETEYFVEVFPFCEGGDFASQKKRFTYNELIKSVIPALNNGLNEIHSAEIVHRDIKPDNLYMYKGKVVIGDFGISRDLGTDGFETDDEKIGTLGYFAPELMSGAAVKQSDYYSLGQTLWTLYSGEMMYGSLLSTYAGQGIAKQREEIKKAMMTNKYFGLDAIPDNEKFFKILMRGLLQYDFNNRFNYKMVVRWLNDDTSVADTLPIDEKDKGFAKPVTLFDVTVRNFEELHHCLATNWEKGKGQFYSGKIGNFISKNDDSMGFVVNEICMTYSKSSEEEDYNYGYALLLMLLCSGKYLCWENEIFSSFAEIAEACDDAIKNNKLEKRKSYRGMLASGILVKWYDDYLSASKSSERFRGMITELQNIAANGGGGVDSVNVARYYLTDKPEKISYEGCKAIEALCEKLINKNNMYRLGDVMIDSDDFYGFLYGLGLGDYSNTLYKLRKGSAATWFDSLYSVLETVCENKALKKKLRIHYCKYGPSAHLIWWKENINLYKFFGTKAKNLENNIKAVKLSDTNTIEDQRKTYAELAKLYIVFKDLFYNNLFYADMGIQKSSIEDGIISNDINAFWCYLFLGQSAPLGFKNYVGL